VVIEFTNNTLQEYGVTGNKYLTCIMVILRRLLMELYVRLERREMY
jgi:hypothetical protein